MKLSIELFLADNLMMNYLILRIAAVLTGEKKRVFFMLGVSAAGAGYAALSLSVLPALMGPVPKMLLTAFMALPLARSWRRYLKGLFCLVLCACLLGGLMFGLVLLTGGGVTGGYYLATVPVRVVLATAFIGALLPRAVATILHALRLRSLRVKLRITLEDRVLLLNALVDSGNLLTEPITGKPVVVLRPGIFSKEGGLPVPFHTVSGTGVLFAHRAKKIEVFDGCWREADALIAPGKEPIGAADAIIGPWFQGEERWMKHGKSQETDPCPDPADIHQPDGYPLHAYRGNASSAISTGGGEEMDRKAHEE